MCIIVSTVFAQISEMRVVGTPKEEPSELVSKEMRDANGEVCAGLIIYSDLTGLSFQSANGIVKRNPASGKDFLFVSPDERMTDSDPGMDTGQLSGRPATSASYDHRPMVVQQPIVHTEVMLGENDDHPGPRGSAPTPRAGTEIGDGRLTLVSSRPHGHGEVPPPQETARERSRRRRPLSRLSNATLIGLACAGSIGAVGAVNASLFPSLGHPTSESVWQNPGKVPASAAAVIGSSSSAAGSRPTRATTCAMPAAKFAADTVKRARCSIIWASPSGRSNTSWPSAASAATVRSSAA